MVLKPAGAAEFSPAPRSRRSPCRGSRAYGAIGFDAQQQRQHAGHGAKHLRHGALRRQSSTAGTEAAAYLWRRGSLSRPRFRGSKSATVERGRALAAAGFDDPLAAIAGGAAVIAVMADEVVKIAGGRRRTRPRGIADDSGWFAQHDRLRRMAGRVFALLAISRTPRGPRSRGADYRVSGRFRHRIAAVFRNTKLLQ